MKLTRKYSASKLRKTTWEEVHGPFGIAKFSLVNYSSNHEFFPAISCSKRSMRENLHLICHVNWEKRSLLDYKVDNFLKMETRKNNDKHSSSRIPSKLATKTSQSKIAYLSTSIYYFHKIMLSRKIIFICIVTFLKKTYFPIKTIISKLPYTSVFKHHLSHIVTTN